MTFYPGVLTAQDITLPVPVADGGTGSATAAAALTALGAAPSASPAFTGSQPTFTTAEGLALTADGSQASLTTPVSLTTSGETVMASLTVPASDPAAGSVYRITAFGYATTDSTSGTLTLNLTWGATSLCSIVFTPTASLTGVFWRVDAVVTFVTASTCNAVMTCWHDTAGSAAFGANTNMSGTASAATVTVSGSEALAIQGTNASPAHVTWVCTGSMSERVW